MKWKSWSFCLSTISTHGEQRMYPPTAESRKRVAARAASIHADNEPTVERTVYIRIYQGVII